MREYFTRDYHPVYEGEKNSGEIKVEKIGYVSPKRQIEALFYNGARFLPPAPEEYDYKTLEECDHDDGSIPIRDSDLIDIAQLSNVYSKESVSGGSVGSVGVDVAQQAASTSSEVAKEAASVE